MLALHNLIFCLLLGLPALNPGQTAKPKEIPPAEAKEHIGETATVCGKVVATSIAKYSAGSLGWPISLDLDTPEPKPTFVIGTLSPTRLKPEEVEATYQGKAVCATGKITNVRGVPEINTSKPSEIDFKQDAKNKNN
jgi:hypothetical protein